jgi:hypothetical protein
MSGMAMTLPFVVSVTVMLLHETLSSTKPEGHGLRVLVDAIGCETLPDALPLTGVSVTSWVGVFQEGPPHWISPQNTSAQE